MNCAGIVQVPDSVLRQVCPEVTEFDAELRRVADRCFDATCAWGRIGVAAPQLGEAVRVFAVDMLSGHPPRVFVNARIVGRSGEQRGQEGCLSVRDRWFDSTRSESVEIEAQDWNGKPITASASRLLARAFQHEIDHLDGILFIDRVREQSTGLIRQQRRQVERQLAKVPA